MKKEARLFKKAAFGGFNKEDVIAYIEKMKMEFAEYKLQVEETMDALNAQISESSEAAGPAEPVSSPEGADSFELGEISAATERLKEVGDSLCENLNALIDRLQSAPAAVDDSVASIMSGLLSAQGAEEPKKEEFVKDTALIESILPSYLR